MSNDIAISASEARAVTDRIKIGVEAIWELIKDAYARRAWEALGYATWDDYCTREFGTSRIKLPREERHEVVASMRELGMSTRAIASATGTNRETVRQELAGDKKLSRGIEPAPVTGADGKTYTQPAKPVGEPVDIELNDGTTYKAHVETIVSDEYVERGYAADQVRPKPRRSPITDDANKIGWELRRVAEKLEEITKDDRYAAQKEKVTPLLRGHLQYAIETAQSVLDGITGKDQS